MARQNQLSKLPIKFQHKSPSQLMIHCWQPWKLSAWKRVHLAFIDPLLHELWFPFIFEIFPKTGSNRLPTHMKCFPWPLAILKFLANVALGSRYAANVKWLRRNRIQVLVFCNSEKLTPTSRFIFIRNMCIKTV